MVKLLLFMSLFKKYGNIFIQFEAYMQNKVTNLDKKILISTFPSCKWYCVVDFQQNLIKFHKILLKYSKMILFIAVLLFWE